MEPILQVDKSTGQGVMFSARVCTYERNALVIRCSDPILVSTHQCWRATGLPFGRRYFNGRIRL